MFFTYFSLWNLGCRSTSSSLRVAASGLCGWRERRMCVRRERAVPYLCNRSRSDVKSTYSDTFRPVMSTRMSPVTTLMRGGLPPTPLGQEKPVPCMEQVHRTGSWSERGRTGEDVTGSEEQTEKVALVRSTLLIGGREKSWSVHIKSLRVFFFFFYII